MVNAISELELELAPGERLLWSSAPVQGLQLTAKDLFFIPFSLAWLGFSLFWEVMVFRLAAAHAGPIRFVMMLFGVPFILVGIYLLIGRSFQDARRRAQTAYGITSQRVMVIQRGQPRKVRSIALAEIHDVQVTERRDRAGTIRLLSTARAGYVKIGREQRFPLPAGEILEFVPRVREAFDILQAALPKQPQAAG